MFLVHTKIFWKFSSDDLCNPAINQTLENIFRCTTHRKINYLSFYYQPTTSQLQIFVYYFKAFRFTYIHALQDINVSKKKTLPMPAFHFLLPSSYLPFCAPEWHLIKCELRE